MIINFVEAWFTVKDMYNQTVIDFETFYLKLFLGRKSLGKFQLISQENEREIILPVVSFDNIQLIGEIGSTAILSFETTNFGLHLEMEITLMPCPAGNLVKGDNFIIF